jgi:hypothetical protein
MANLRAPNKGMERDVPTSRPSCSLASLSPVPKHVARLVWKLERHYLQPVHAMFRLPIPHYRVWASFSSGLRICYAIAGVSTTLYEQSGSNGERFRQLLLNYYPFILEPANAVPSIDAARTLWSVFRNSLAHDLGFDVERHAKTPETKLMRVLTRVRVVPRRHQLCDDVA